jgi:hypothetical protein
VSGRHLVDGVANVVQLRGVNRAAFESRCTYLPGLNPCDTPLKESGVTAAYKADVMRKAALTGCPEAGVAVRL